MKIFYSLLLFSIYGLISCDQIKNQEKEKFDTQLFFYKSIIGELLPNECNCTLVDSLFVLTYEVENSLKSRIENFNSFFSKTDTIYKQLLRNLIISKSMKNGDLIAHGKCKNINKTILFTEPIFDKEHSKAVAVVSLICGKECKETTLLFLEYKNENWKIISKNIISVQ